MTEFRGIKARLRELGVPEPTSRRAAKRQRKATSIDLAGTLTSEDARTFIAELDRALDRIRTERPR